MLNLTLGTMAFIYNMYLVKKNNKKIEKRLSMRVIPVTPGGDSSTTKGTTKT